MVFPSWFDPALPRREDAVLRPVLERHAAATPDKVFARFADGLVWTYADMLVRARATAAGLQALGVRRGDRVLAWAGNGPDLLRLWFAANLLGAVHVPLNTAYRGTLLAHAIAKAGAAVMVVQSALATRLADLPLGPVREVVVLDGPTPDLAVRCHGAAALDGDAASLVLPDGPDLWDEYAIIYTSGTTGPSKGVLSSYMQLWTVATCAYGYARADDTMLINLPMFHAGGTASIYAMLLHGGTIALVDGFSASRFWSQVREHQATLAAGLIGAMADFLAKAPPRPDDADNPLRACNIVPTTDFMVAFARRFGFAYRAGFNMSEVSCPLATELDPADLPPGSCGRPRTGVQVRIVDAHDIEVPIGAVGELIVRTDHPWAMSHGYNAEPEATARAWRNGWFHTGDGFRRDADGWYYFVDRLKDTIRRRGENVSSVEVEAEAAAHPAVAAAAAVAVPADESEDEILLAVALRPGAALAPADLVVFLAPRLPYFMVPRYLRILPDLPRTPTGKVRKHLLREAGIPPDTFDRVAAGIVVPR